MRSVLDPWQRYLGPPLAQYALFTGRTQRRDYWMFVLLTLVLMTLFTSIDEAVAAWTRGPDVDLLQTAFGVLTLVPMLAITARRLHDVGRSAQLIWWVLVPLVGLIVLLGYLVQPSEQGVNAWGAPPTGGAVAPHPG